MRAEDSILRGEEEAQRSKLATRRAIGSQRAAMAGGGVVADMGSALDLQLETAGYGAMDESTIRANAWRESFGHRASASNLYGQARMSRLAARGMRNATLITGGLNAARDLGFGLYNYQRLRPTTNAGMQRGVDATGKAMSSAASAVGRIW